LFRSRECFEDRAGANVREEKKNQVKIVVKRAVIWRIREVVVILRADLVRGWRAERLTIDINDTTAMAEAIK